MNYIFWIKNYTKIYIFWSYSNQEVIFWFIILFYSFCLYTVLLGSVCSNLTFYNWFYIEIYLIIFHSYDIVMTGYMHTIIALCVLNDYVSFYKVIFIIYIPIKVPVAKWFRTQDHAVVSWCRAVTDCAMRSEQNSVLVDHIWAYSFILTYIYIYIN